MTKPLGSLVPLLAVLVLAVACGDGASVQEQRTSSPTIPATPHADLAGTITPGAGIPALTAEDKALIREIALADPRLLEVLEGREYEIGEPFIWHSSGRLEKLGGGMIVTFPEPFTLEREWIQVDYDETETSSPPFQVVIAHFKVEDIEELYLRVDFLSGELVEMNPMGGRASNYTPPADFTPFPTSGAPRD